MVQYVRFFEDRGGADGALRLLVGITVEGSGEAALICNMFASSRRAVSARR
jgi:hypothetical protein